VFVIAATAEYASGALANLKSHLSGNPLLLEDYPEAVYPIRCLEGESRRCGGQRYYGVQNHIGWTAEQVVLPTIPASRCSGAIVRPASRCSGAIVRTAGLLGNVRGALHVRPDGSAVRPDCPISTAAPEGTNTKIKLLQRQAYGYRNMEFFRLKIYALHKTAYALVG